MTSTKPSKKFYTAVNRIAKGDASLMGDIWSHGGTVTTMHPSGGRESGWGQVRKSWEDVAKLISAGTLNSAIKSFMSAATWRTKLGVEHGEITAGGYKVSLSHRALDTL